MNQTKREKTFPEDGPDNRCEADKSKRTWVAPNLKRIADVRNTRGGKSPTETETAVVWGNS